jgi:hypothetical protein
MKSQFKIILRLTSKSTEMIRPEGPLSMLTQNDLDTLLQREEDEYVPKDEEIAYCVSDREKQFNYLPEFAGPMGDLIPIAQRKGTPQMVKTRRSPGEGMFHRSRYTATNPGENYSVFPVMRERR